MYRPGFGVVTSVLAFLCLLAVVIRVLQPSIPPTPANRVAQAEEDFLRQAGNQPVDWRRISPEAIRQARLSGRPILVLIGTPVSTVGRRLDAEVFSASEIAAYLSRNFYCIRVDAGMRPQWLNTYLPFSRLAGSFDPDLQIWALDPFGRAYGFIARSGSDDQFDSDTLLRQLIDLRKRFERLPENGTSELGDIQRREEVLLLAQPGSAVPEFGPYREKLIRDALQAWARDGLVHPKPWVWSYLLRTGDWHAMWASEKYVLSSPLVDVTDGGFFHTWVNPDGQSTVELEKQAVENAETMSVLAEIAAATGDESSRHFVEECWRYLEETAHADRGFYYGQVELSGPGIRSPHYSVSSKRARETLSPELRDWGVRHLGLDLGRYSQGVPYFESTDWRSPKTEQLLDAMRRTAGPKAEGAEPGLADVSLTCAARAIRTARLMGDRSKLQEAIGWIEELEMLRSGGDIRRRTSGGNPRMGPLSAYLAYADARLQDYLATGRVRSFDLGLAVLQRARRLFRERRRGVFKLNRPDLPAPAPDSVFPEIVDNLHESTTAKAIRLMLSYGRLLGHDAEGADLQREAREAVGLFAAIAAQGDSSVAGFYSAAAEATDSASAFCVGGFAVEMANSLSVRVPTRLVAPVYGSVRRDLRSRAPGIYIEDGGVSGPYSVEEAAKRLGTRLRLRP